LNNKIETYLGFAVKSGKIVFGFDNLCETRKKVKLVICSPTVNNKIKQKLILLCKHKKWELIETLDLLEELIYRDNCKVVGITDDNLASAIMKMENIKLLQGSNKFGEE